MYSTYQRSGSGARWRLFIRRTEKRTHQHRRCSRFPGSCNHSFSFNIAMVLVIYPCQDCQQYHGAVPFGLKLQAVVRYAESPEPSGCGQFNQTEMAMKLITKSKVF